MTANTKLETVVLNSITKLTMDSWGPTLQEILDDTGIDKKVLRGVLGSLVKKDKIFIDDGDESKPDLYCLVEW